MEEGWEWAEVSAPQEAVRDLCVFQGSRDRMLRGGERDRFPSAVNRLGMGDGSSDLTLACSFHLQIETIPRNCRN